MIFRELKIAALVLLSATCITHVSGQQTPRVESRISPQSVMIGDPFTLSIDVECDVMQRIAFPEFNIEGEQSEIEYVMEPTIDTIESDGRRVHLRRNYTLRSFEEGRYNLGRTAVLYMDKNIIDTLYSADSMLLEVLTYQIDTATMSIFDIKPQRDMPFKVAEISGYIKWGVIALILLAVLIYVALRVLAHYGKSVGGLFKPAPPVPPHIKAIEDLEQLHNKKLWQSNKHKQYYSGLTDIIRTYISGRYSITAMEMTTDEIFEAIRDLDIPNKCAMDLQSLLREADLVKFAKATPNAEENEAYYNKSYHFVEETKIEEESIEESENEIEENRA